MKKIMLIDDDEDIRFAMRRLLEENGYGFVAAADGREGLRMLLEEGPDLLLLDVMLPGMSGFDVCRLAREAGCVCPVIFLSAKGDIVDKGVGFHAGGDDYVVKPFNSFELLLRIEANIRRYGANAYQAHERAGADSPSGAIEIGDLRIVPERYEVYRKGALVKTTAKEFQALVLLASSPGVVFTREQISEHLWGGAESSDAGNVTVLVHRLRRKLEDDSSRPRYILSVWRVGYKFAGGE